MPLNRRNLPNRNAYHALRRALFGKLCFKAPRHSTQRSNESLLHGTQVGDITCRVIFAADVDAAVVANALDDTHDVASRRFKANFLADR